MRVEVCEAGGNKVVVVPQPNRQCTFVEIDSWDENAHPKNCDTMYFLSDGSGAYVWNCDKWVFLDFSNGNGGSSVQADWNAEESDPEGIKNRPFKTISDEFTVKSDELALNANVVKETVYRYRVNLPNNITDLNFDNAEALCGWFTISSIASRGIQNVPPGYEGTSFLLEAISDSSRPMMLQRVWSAVDGLNPMYRMSANGSIWNEWKEI